MSDQRPFIELAMQGHVDLDELNDFIDFWHGSTGDQQLHDFLGLSWDEYSLLGSDSGALPTIIRARMERIPLARAVNDNLRYEERIAARSDNASKIAALHRWIAEQPDR